MDISRRAFLRGTGGGIAVTALGALGFGGIEMALAADIKPYRLARTVQTRNTCTYCSVACGIIMYSPGNTAKGEHARLLAYRGRSRPSDQSRHALPERRGVAGLRSCADAHEVPLHPRCEQRQVRGRHLGLSRSIAIARLMKDDRDRNFIAKNADGTTVNRWLSTGFLAASATTNETASWRPTRSCAAPGCWCSTTKRGSDTAPRCPVWAQRLVAER